MNFSTIIGVIAVAVGSFCMYCKWPLPEVPVDLTNKVIVITGASAGVGKESAKLLAHWNATIIMAVRNPEKAAKVKDYIMSSYEKEEEKKEIEEHLIIKTLDLSSFDSVRNFSDEMLTLNQPIDVLMNNAGLIADNEEFTKDGYEKTLQTNHLGHFLLTKELMPLLGKGNIPSRIVHVSSDAHYMGKVDFLNLNKFTGSFQTYCNTKLYNVLFSNELQRRINLKGLNIMSTSLHPGAVATEFFRNSNILMNMMSIAKTFIARTEYEGALTQVWAASHPSLEQKGGVYLDRCALKTPLPIATDTELMKKFWEASEDMIGKKFQV